MATFEVLKNRLTNGKPYNKQAAIERIESLIDDLIITQGEADELFALADANATTPDHEERITALEGKFAPLDKIGIRTERKPSERPGEDIITYYIGDQPMRSEYVSSESTEGAAENPIPWTPDMLLKPNFHYIHNGVRKVWTGESLVTAQWDDERWETF